MNKIKILIAMFLMISSLAQAETVIEQGITYNAPATPFFVYATLPEWGRECYSKIAVSNDNVIFEDAIYFALNDYVSNSRALIERPWEYIRHTGDCHVYIR